jgi:hypothetical protein
MDKKTVKELLGKKGVVAVGTGFKFTDGKKTPTVACICSVEKKLPMGMIAKKDLIPKTVNDGPLSTVTDVIETGKIKALADPTKYHRPAPAGVSVGHVNVTAGTLGCWVKSNEDPQDNWYILSNNHVLANVNQGQFDDNIVQPGIYDGGLNPQHTIAKLVKFVPIEFTEMPAQCDVAKLTARLISKFAQFLNRNHRVRAYQEPDGENLVDCAIAVATSPNHVNPTINNLGNHSGQIVESFLDMRVQKDGRTTQVTSGDVEQTDVTVIVDMGGGMSAIFTDQIVSGNSMSAPGDSGSLILDMDKNITGLLFAGSDEITVYNRIQNVIAALNIRFN